VQAGDPMPIAPLLGEGEKETVADVPIIASCGLNECFEQGMKAIGWEKAEKLEIVLDIELTDELRREGAARELTRHINSLRKNAGLTRQDRIIVRYETSSDFWKAVIAEHVEAVRLDVLSEGFEEGKKKVDSEKDVDLNGEKIWLGVEKI